MSTRKHSKTKVKAPKRISKRGRVNEGRPPKYVTAKDFIKRAAEYFHYCDTRIKTFIDSEGEATTQVCPAPYTIEGLVDYCDIYRDTMHGWEKGERGQEFSDAVKDCKRKIHSNWAERVQENRNPAGVIFYGKAALGYRDVQTMEHSGPNGTPIQSRTVIEFEDSPATGGPDPTKPKK